MTDSGGVFGEDGDALQCRGAGGGMVADEKGPAGKGEGVVDLETSMGEVESVAHLWGPSIPPWPGSLSRRASRLCPHGRAECRARFRRCGSRGGEGVVDRQLTRGTHVAGLLAMIRPALAAPLEPLCTLYSQQPPVTAVIAWMVPSTAVQPTASHKSDRAGSGARTATSAASNAS